MGRLCWKLSSSTKLPFLEQTVSTVSQGKRMCLRAVPTDLVLKMRSGRLKTAIATIWPDQRYLETTISTLRFAVRDARWSDLCIK
jgi:hypothetical protein